MCETESEARQHPYFPQFENWARENGYWSEHFDDWGPWFEAFAAGAQAVIKFVTKFKKG